MSGQDLLGCVPLLWAVLGGLCKSDYNEGLFMSPGNKLREVGKCGLGHTAASDTAELQALAGLCVISLSSMKGLLSV